jgi:hypothetical protein
MSQSTLLHGETGSIAGYDYGKQGVARSPVSLEELRQIEETIGWTQEDAGVLQRHGDIFRGHAEEMVDAWRAIIAEQPHLAKWFFGPDGKPDNEYKARVKSRFVQWVEDVCFRPHDQAWLNYQEEIALRHTPEKKDRTDHAQAPPLVPLRYIIAFVPAMVISTRRFFVDAGVKGHELQKLQDAWARAIQLNVTLLARPFAREGLW